MSKFPWYQAVQQNKFVRFFPRRSTIDQLFQAAVFCLAFVLPMAWVMVEQLSK